MRFLGKNIQSKCNRTFNWLTFGRGKSPGPVSRVRGIFLLFALLLTSVTMQAQFSGSGSGTASAPYEIATPVHLNEVRNNMLVHYKLVNDIDLTPYLAFGGAGHNSGAGWLPIGDNSTPFSGSFDGGGFTISGLWIDRNSTDYVGLFGCTSSATIKDLGIVINGAIIGQTYVGGLAGTQSYGVQGNTTFINCFTEGNVTATGSVAGGLVGMAIAFGGNCSISNCYTTGGVITSSNGMVGGLVGSQIAENSGNILIENCYSTNDIIELNNFAAGGLVGLQATNNGTAKIINCYTTGNVQGLRRVGGIVGYQSLTSSGNNFIENCYSTSEVTGDSSIGGIVGRQDATGTTGSNNVSNCFSVNNINPVVLIESGIIVGHETNNMAGASNNFNNNFRFKDVTINSSFIPLSDTRSTLNGMNGLNTSEVQFMTQQTYLNNSWTFNATAWQWDNNEKYPMLGFGPEAYPFPFYAITYNLDGGVLPSSPTPEYSYVPSNLPYTLPLLTKTQYNFDGWFDSSNTLVTNIPSGTTGHQEFWAQWTKYIFDIIVIPSSYGSVTINKSLAQAGETITITAAPYDGCEIISFTVYQTGNPSVVVTNSPVSSFIMPAYDVTVNVTFQRIPIVPSITGPTEMTLLRGYKTTSTDTYKIGGDSPVKITKTSGDALITWNDITKCFDIIEGLPVGVYPVQLRASNIHKSITFTFTLTVEVPLYYLDLSQSFVGGTVTTQTNNPNPYLAEEGDKVTLIVTPDKDYELSEIVVYKLDDKLNVVVPVSGNGNTFTFIMPAHHVTIVAVFKSTRTGIEDIHNSMKVYVENGTLYLSEIMVGEVFHVYSITGALIYQGITTGSKMEIILPSRGIYIITCGGKTMKIVN